MATTRVLSKEDGDLQTSTIITSRSRVFRDIDMSFTAKPNGELYVKKDAAAVKQAVKNLIQTNHFEKPFLPFYGGNIRAQLFELADNELDDELEDNIIYSIETFEPRAQILNIDVDVQPDYNSLRVRIDFKVVNSDEVITFSTVISRLR